MSSIDWDRELTDLEHQQIRQMMELNPSIDYLLAETIVLIPEARRNEIIQNRKDNPIEPEPAKVLTEEEQHNCHVLSAEEQIEVEEERERRDAERLALYDKIEAEKEEAKLN